MYKIHYRDIKREGATYNARNYRDAITIVTQLLEHGTKYVGHRIENITITRKTASNQETIINY